MHGGLATGARRRGRVRLQLRRDWFTKPGIARDGRATSSIPHVVRASSPGSSCGVLLSMTPGPRSLPPGSASSYLPHAEHLRESCCFIPDRLLQNEFRVVCDSSLAMTRHAKSMKFMLTLEYFVLSRRSYVGQVTQAEHPQHFSRSWRCECGSTPGTSHGELLGCRPEV